MNRQIVDKVYGAFVNQVPGIRERYKQKRNQTRGLGRINAWIYLLYLNVAYHIFRRKKLGIIEKYPYYESKKLYSEGSESSLSKREAPKTFAKDLATYDVVSFDVFDTLIFRPFSSPADLFFLLGDALEYMDFKRIRQEMEWKAREKKYKQEKHYEVNLDEIYTLLSEETGIAKEKGMALEIELEEKFCFANPYMMKVIKELRKQKKRIIITSDMYLNTEQIKKLLLKCGYDEFDAYYVSCDIGKSKSSGNLYDEVRHREENLQGKRLTFVHTGDNFVADIEHAKKHEFSPRHYVNVNAAGEQYRAEDMSAITGSLYRGIVNAHIHNGLKEYSREYEYGYIYGGLFATGYCQFIHEYVKQHKVDKILFLARDGYVLKKAYETLYPEEVDKCRYVYWSRLAATKMSAGYFKYDYFRRFLYHKVNQNYILKDIVKSMELDDMLEELCKESGYTENTILTDKNVDSVKSFFMKYWDKVLKHYEEQLEAGKQYFKEILQGSNTAVAVDIGWAGSGAITLNHIVNEIWEMNCPITGIIAGTNTCHNAEPDASETFLQSGKLVSYLYSQRENRDIWKFHDPGKNHNLYWEMLLDAPHGSLKGFYLDESGKWECRLKKEDGNMNNIIEVQRGILSFLNEYRKIQNVVGDSLLVSGRDAYAAMVITQEYGNVLFMDGISQLMDRSNME